ncbi:MAG: putative DNA binding domain-containing protein [Lachnospiraceae bacterium]|nr:putative DNA binding domain-containing protein [Lachnospiraceae bacterium]
MDNYKDSEGKAFSQSSQESQSTEWKWSWQDEYLKWLCGYANTDGGSIYIGVNDDGYIVGAKDSTRLLEGLPNKINDKLGVLASVKVFTGRQGDNIRYGNAVPQNISSKLINQYACGLISLDRMEETDRRYKTLAIMEKENPIYIAHDGTMDYIEITVPRYPFAISCDGKYYKRSGSVLHELNGFELQNFLLERARLTWDAVPMPDTSAEDLSKEALAVFRKKAVAKKRMTEAEASAPDDVLLHDLKLYDRNHLVRAALLMFHPDPEQYVTGAYIKIAYFAPAGAYGQNKVDDIIYSDDVHGPLMTQVDKAIDLIYTKYLKALISYDGLQRVETFLWPKEGFREVLLNSVNHKAYETGIPIQIRVYDDKITIWNDGQWPDKIDVAKVYERHPSIPHNPKMADVFYRSGEIESWGSGFDKIKMECDQADAPYPVINANPKGGVELVCNACDLYMKLLKYGRYYDTYPKEESAETQIADSLSSQESKSIDRMMEILSRELSDKEKVKILPIVEYLKSHDKIDARTASEVTGRSRATASRYLQQLVKLNVLEKRGDSVTTTFQRK